MRQHGKAVTEAVLLRLGQTVHAAAASAEVAEALRSGRLLREPEAPSIDALLGSMPEPAAVTKVREIEADTVTADAAEAERLDLLARIADAQLETDRARAEARSAARAAAEAYEAWEAARRTADERELSREEADERLNELRRASRAALSAGAIDAANLRRRGVRRRPPVGIGAGAAPLAVHDVGRRVPARTAVSGGVISRTLRVPGLA